MKVAIVDYGMCNLDSVARAVEECGATPVVTDQAGDLRAVSKIILPGVGAFPDGMRCLKERSLDRVLYEQVSAGIPLLGICLGMQLMALTGTEGTETPGLGWIDGEVRRLQPSVEDHRIPHIGWNEVHVVRESPLFKGVPSGQNFYFVHSYHLCPCHESEIVARTPYGAGFVAAVQRDSIFGVQFHPEKSQRAGFQVLRNFLAL